MLPAGGAVIDTPGLRAVGLQGDSDGVTAAFPDIDAYSAGCRFRDCTHVSEPDCAVLAAVEAGELSDRRLRSWFALGREQERMAARHDARLAAERKKKWKIITKQHRAGQGPRP